MKPYRESVPYQRRNYYRSVVFHFFKTHARFSTSPFASVKVFKQELLKKNMSFAGIVLKDFIKEFKLFLIQYWNNDAVLEFENYIAKN